MTFAGAGIFLPMFGGELCQLIFCYRFFKVHGRNLLLFGFGQSFVRFPQML
jgi:hypothetical protein